MLSFQEQFDMRRTEFHSNAQHISQSCHRHYNPPNRQRSIYDTPSYQLLTNLPPTYSKHKRIHTTISSLLPSLIPRKPLSLDTTTSNVLRCDAVTPSLQTYQHRLGSSTQKRVSDVAPEPPQCHT